MWELNYKEIWVPKNWCFWTVVLENTLESPLDCKEIQPVHPKVNKSWIFIGRTDAEAETPILWPPDVKNWLNQKILWCWEWLEVEWEGDDRGWDGQMASPTGWSLSKLRELVMNREAWRAVVHGVTKSQTWLSNWTELNWLSTVDLWTKGVWNVRAESLHKLFWILLHVDLSFLPFIHLFSYL